LTINMKILDVPQSGKTHDMVSYKTRHGQFRREYVVPHDPRTQTQLDRRAALRRATRLWGTLTDPQRAAWNAAAHGARTQPRLNQSGALTGYLLFVRINCNLASVGQPMVLDPITPPQFGPSPVGQLIITNTKGAIAIKLSVTAKPAQYVVILATKPRGAGVSYVDHFSILGVLPDPTNGMSDITDLFIARYRKPRVGSRIFIQTFQLIDGWEDLPRPTSALVPARQTIARPMRQVPARS
jgi:hypothetical protein